MAAWRRAGAAEVDDLLDELNGLLDDQGAAPPPQKAPQKAPPQHQTGGHPPTPSGARSRGAAEDDIDALLEEFDDDAPATRSAAVRASALPASHVAASAVASSASPFLSDTATGYRCSKCDLRVLRFTDQQWAPDVDYMFLRNFMPNVDKLQAKLRARDGHCAYSCQCTWVTAELGLPHGVPHWFTCR